MAAERQIEMNAVDISHCRDDFPILKTQMNGKPLAFLDSGASAQKPRQVIDVMREVQESGYSTVTSLPFNLRIGVLGIYPTLETVASQLLVVVLVLILWKVNLSSSRKAAK